MLWEFFFFALQNFPLFFIPPPPQTNAAVGMQSATSLPTLPTHPVTSTSNRHQVFAMDKSNTLHSPRNNRKIIADAASTEVSSLYKLPSLICYVCHIYLHLYSNHVQLFKIWALSCVSPPRCFLICCAIVSVKTRTCVQSSAILNMNLKTFHKGIHVNWMTDQDKCGKVTEK